MRPIPQVTKEEVAEEREALKAIDARPIKKVAEAKARKRKRMQVGAGVMYTLLLLSAGCLIDRLRHAFRWTQAVVMQVILFSQSLSHANFAHAMVFLHWQTYASDASMGLL